MVIFRLKKKSQKKRKNKNNYANFCEDATI